MKKNVGTFDALMRITCGLTGVAWGTAKMIRHPYRSFPMAVTLASAMKVAEGVTRFCPMLAMLNMNSKHLFQSEDGTQSGAQHLEHNSEQSGNSGRRRVQHERPHHLGSDQ